MRAAALALLVAGCLPADGPLMRPGEDCLACHSETAPAGQRARTWSLAGTVYPSAEADASAGVEGAQVEVTDAAGRSFSLRTNQAGNFYSAESVAFPLRLCVSHGGASRCMEAPAASGACNACHLVVGEIGRIVAP